MNAAAAGDRGSWKLADGLAGLFLLILAAVILAQANPWLTLPNTDGGFFLYAGRQILNGKLPYVDFWDSKGPGVYYLNALGLYLGHGLRWGVWLIEYAFLAATLFLLYRLTSREWGRGAAALGLIFGSVALNRVLDGGNLTEEYSLLFNAIALYMFWLDARASRAESSTSENPRTTWKYAVIGLTAGLSFSFRANNIGIPIAIALAVLIDDLAHRRLRLCIYRLGLMAAGFLAPIAVSGLYFALKGALPDWINAAFLYNFRYAGSRTRSLMDLLAGFGRDKLSWPAWFALGGAILALGTVVWNALHHKTVGKFDILLAALLWIEILLSALSWRQFIHYFIPWMPAIVLLVAFLAARLFAVLRLGLHPRIAQHFEAPLWGLLVVALLVVARVEVGQYAQTVSQVLFRRSEGVELKDYLSNYVDQHTGENDAVLTWPGNPWINFASGRASPVRLVFYPIFDAGTISVAQGQSYLDDLRSVSPALIIDCTDLQEDVPSLDAETRQTQAATRDFLFSPPSIQQVYDFVSTHYHVETRTTKCTIYRKNP